MNNVQQYFKDYPGKQKCFETSDGLVFHENGDANLHASSLKDAEVKVHTAAKNTVSDAGKATEPAKNTPAKNPLSAVEMAQAKVDGFEKALAKAKTDAAKEKAQKNLDAAKADLDAAIEAALAGSEKIEEKE